MEENQKDYKVCAPCGGRGEVSKCCDAKIKMNKVGGFPVLPVCTGCNKQKPHTYDCSYCEGCGEEPECAERDREEDARESYLEALRDE